MAKRPKSVEVQKFGGMEDLGVHTMNGHKHDTQSLEAQSKTSLEMDAGHGDAAIIRCFTFGINAASFKEAQPTRQELFNSHLKGIEISLWRDGMKILPTVQPRIVINQDKMNYQIFVGAKPAKGHILHERPQTLSEIAHG